MNNGIIYHERKQKMDKHHELGPSNYSVWAVCPSAELSGGETKESAEGTAVHQQIQMALDGIEDAEDYRAAWAVRALAELAGDSPIASEQRVSGEVGEFGTIFGTVDAMWIDGGVRHIADFKTFATFGAEHIPQLMGYGALAGKPGESIVLHVLCGGSLTVHTVETTYEECLESTLRILRNHKHDKMAVANSKCKYCTKCATCSSCATTINALSPIEATRNLVGHMSLPEKLAVCSMVEKVIEGIKKAAKEEANKNGGVLEADGVRYELKPSSTYKVKDMGFILDDMNFNKQFTGKKRGKEYTVDVAVPDAYEFVARCNISRTTLADLVASKNPGMTKKDVTEWVTQFYEKVDGEPKLVRVS